MKSSKLKLLSLSIGCLISVLCSVGQGMEEESQKIQSGGKRYLMDSQSQQLDEDQDAKNKNDKLGAEARITNNQVGRGYIDKPNQQEILKKNQEKK